MYLVQIPNQHTNLVLSYLRLLNLRITIFNNDNIAFTVHKTSLEDLNSINSILKICDIFIKCLIQKKDFN